MSNHKNIRLYCQELMQEAGEIALKAFKKPKPYSLKPDHSYLTETVSLYASHPSQSNMVKNIIKPFTS